jgi:hypothetical protein
MSAIKLRPAVGLALAGTLAALAACAVLASGASAATGFTFCYPKTGGAFEGGACKIKGSTHAYAAATPATGGVLAFCEEQSGGAYDSAFCTEKGSATDWELKSSSTKAPKLVGTSGPTTLSWNLAGTKTEIKCGGGAFKTAVEPKGVTSKGEIELTSCKVIGLEECVVKSPGGGEGQINIIGGSKGRLEESSGKPVYTMEDQEGESTFMVLEFIGVPKCALQALGTVAVKGHQQCEFDTYSAVLKEDQQVICKASGSSLKFAAEKFNYEGTFTVGTEGEYMWSPDASSLASEPWEPSKHKLHYCHKVGSEEGPFSNAKCSEAGGSGEYLSAWPGTATTLFACHKVASGKGAYQNSACTEAGGAKDWELEEPAWSSKLEGQASSVILKSKVGGTPMTLKCTKDTLEVLPHPEGETQEGKLSLSSCTALGLTNCTVKEPIVGSVSGQLEESAGKLVDKLTGSGESEAIAKLTFEGEKCAAKGLAPTLKGTETAEFDSSIGTFQEKHELISKLSGGKLKLGAEKAEYEGTMTVTAPGGETWSAS